jgi:hypothetical protein
MGGKMVMDLRAALLDLLSVGEEKLVIHARRRSPLSSTGTAGAFGGEDRELREHAAACAYELHRLRYRHRPDDKGH